MSDIQFTLPSDSEPPIFSACDSVVNLTMKLNGVARNITGFTFKLIFRKSCKGNQGIGDIEINGTITNAVGGLVQFPIANTVFPNSGTYYCTIQYTTPLLKVIAVNGYITVSPRVKEDTNV